MIIYMCIKYEAYTLIFSKDINRKPFFKQKFKLKRADSQNNWSSLPKIKRDLYSIVMYLYIKYEADTIIFCKDN